MGRGQEKIKNKRVREREEKKSMSLSVLCAAYYTSGLPYSHPILRGEGGGWGGVEWHQELGEVKSLVDSRITKSKSPRIHRPPQTHGSDHHVIADICPGSVTIAHGS